MIAVASPACAGRRTVAADPTRRGVGSAAFARRTVLLVVVAVAPLVAQARPDSAAARRRDSLLAAVLADTSDVELAEALTDLLVPTRGGTIAVRPLVRRYRVGDVVAVEQVATTTMRVRGERWAIRGTITPVRYRAEGTTVTGTTPFELRADLRLRDRDTLRLAVQTGSRPASLGADDAAAIGAVGTGTLDLDALALPSAPRVGARYTSRVALGATRTALVLRAGVDVEPRPGGTTQVFWRGTTVRGGIGLERRPARGDGWELATLVEATRSSADSLGGRNLFGGGGALTVDARAARPIGRDDDGQLVLAAFWSRPVGLERPDQPTRLIPIGDAAGLTVTAVVPTGPVEWLPSVGVVHERSAATATVAATQPGRPPIRTTLDASGTAATLGLALAIPLGRWTLTPDAGLAIGTVGQRFTQGLVFPRRVVARGVAFDDAIRGGWLALDVAVRW